jgi:hypothetical protein
VNKSACLRKREGGVSTDQFVLSTVSANKIKSNHFKEFRINVLVTNFPQAEQPKSRIRKIPACNPEYGHPE